VLREGKQSFYIPGLSIGKLSVVAARNLWQLPWHLGAMEFQHSFDGARQSLLRTQSQWDNASWDLAEAAGSPNWESVPGSMQSLKMVNYFFA